MATYYWGGGTGTWSSTAVTNWYTDVGRTTLSTVAPTSADDVIFDSASSGAAYTVTISTSAACRNWTAAGPATGNVTFAGSLGVSIHGSVSWTPTGITRTYTGVINFNATTGSHTIDFGGIQLSNNVSIGPNSASTAVWTMLSNMIVSGSSTAQLSLTSGTLDTNGFNLTFVQFTSSSTTFARSILLRTGTHRFGVTGNTSAWSTASTNLTFDAGTSTVIITIRRTVNHTTGPITFYNLTIEGANISGSGTFTITNVLSFGNTADTINTISGTITAETIEWWTTARTSRTQRKGVIFNSTTTVTANNFINFENVELARITAAGSAPWTTGTSIGDLGGNTGITFATPKTVYWNNPGGSTYHTNSWATQSGGLVADANYPLPQDTVIIDDTGLNSGASITLPSTVSFNNTFMGSLDSSSRTLPWNLGSVSQADLYVSGDFKGSSGSMDGGTNLNVKLIGSGTLNSAGSTFNFFTFQIECILTTGTYTLGSNNVSINAFTVGVNRGTLSLGAFNLSAKQFSTAGTVVGSVSTSGGVINVFGNNATVVSLQSSAVTVAAITINLTYSGGAGTRTLTTSSVNVSIRNVNYNITAGTDIVRLGSGNFYGNNIDFTGFSGSVGVNTGTNIYGNITFSPTMTTISSTNPLVWWNITTGSTRTIDTKGVIMNFPVTLAGVEPGTLNTWNLASNYVSTQALNHERDIFNTNNYNITAASISFSGGGGKTANLGSSTITLNVNASTTPWSASSLASMPVNTGTSTIIINQTTGTLTSTFTGGARTYNNVYYNGNVNGILRIVDSNTINYFENISTTPVTIRLSSGATNTFGTLKLNGVRGRRVALQSISTLATTVAKSGGGVSENDYLDLSYVNASAANTFYAGRYSTTVAGTSTNWVFNFFTKPKIGNALGFFH